ncbi:MAG: mechanosensitive ion channel family protein [Alphaproteobacteria bacterium]|nr:mechanosensitive ion channel family protein [Alphaproteobacteria bacterium]
MTTVARHRAGCRLTALVVVFLCVTLLPAMAQVAGGKTETELWDQAIRAAIPGESNPDFNEQDLHLTDLTIARWRGTLEAAKPLLTDDTDLTKEQISILRGRLIEIEVAATDRRALLDKRIIELTAQRDALGPSPNDPTDQETSEIKGLRTAIEARLAATSARTRAIGLIAERSRQLIERANRTRAQQLRDQLLERYPAPVRPAVFLQGITDFVELVRGGLRAPLAAVVVHGPSASNAVPPLVFVLIGLTTLWAWTRFWLERRYGWRLEVETPSYARKVLAAVIVALSRGAVPAALIAAPISLILSMDVIHGEAASIVSAAGSAVARYLVMLGLVMAALAPDRAAWRLTTFTEPAARAIYRRSLILLATLHFSLFVLRASEVLDTSPELTATSMFLISLVLALNILALLRRENWEQATVAAVPDKSVEGLKPEDTPDEDERSGLDLGAILRTLLAVVAVASPVFGAIGYSQIAVYLVGHLIDAGFLVLVLVLTRGLVRDVCSIVQIADGQANRFAKSAFGLSDAGLERAVFWLNLVTDVVIVLLGVAGLALIFGVSGDDLQLAARRAFAGITIGSVQVSPGTFVAAVVTFVVGVAITRLVQRGLAQRIFPRTHIDPGVQNSVSAGIGYVGFALAVLVAIAVTGLDLSNLALIAGALSVGIGFGLQAIVNNFVSGLILLIERPVKVGDWIKIGDHEGTVKRINVRSTEIQTFQRSEVIIPNSDLISSSVINYTHRDRYGRIEIGVPVAYGTDPDRVGEILLEVAQANPMVAHWPEPHLYFHAFDDHAMRMRLRVYLIDINNFVIVTSDLHFAIVKRLREEGIAFPLPRRDVRMLDTDPQTAPEGSSEPA